MKNKIREDKNKKLVSSKKDNEKKVSCPYCSEQILSSAMKCRFCGEWIKEEYEKKEGKFSTPVKPLLLWALSLILFYLILYLSNHSLSGQVGKIVFFLLGDIIIGFLFFTYTTLLILRNLIKKVEIKKSLIYLLAVIITTTLFFYSFTFIEIKDNSKFLGPDEVIAKINATRESRGSSRLNKKDSLSQAAKSVAEKLCEADEWGLETDSDYYKKIAIDFGYKSNGVGVTMIEGVYDLDDLANVWITSENTKNIMLSNDFEDIGVGIVKCETKSLNKTADIVVSFYSTENLIPVVSKKTITITPEPTPKEQPAVQQDDEWGKAVQQEDGSYTMRVNMDERMSTANELYEALMSYRSVKNKPRLSWDDKLASYAQERAIYIHSNGLDGHIGFNDFISNQGGYDKLGYRHLGENMANMKMTGVHLVEWIYAQSPGHEANQLGDWSHIGIGVYGDCCVLVFSGAKL
jgi:uncharacterized protein YkwD